MGIISTFACTQSRAEKAGIDYARKENIRAKWDPDHQTTYIEIEKQRVYLWSPTETIRMNQNYKNINWGIKMLVPVTLVYLGYAISNRNMSVYYDQRYPTQSSIINGIANMLVGFQIKSIFLDRYLHLNECAMQAAAKYAVEHHVEPMEGQPGPIELPPAAAAIANENVIVAVRDANQSASPEVNTESQSTAISNNQYVEPVSSSEDNLTTRLLPA